MTLRGKLFHAGAGVLLAIFAVAAQPAAAAGSCIQDVWQAHGNNQNLTCTAQDVTLSSVTNIDITNGGQCVGGVCKCFLGGNVTFSATFQMDLTADTRYDIGFYIATDADITPKGALTGQCLSTAVFSSNGLNFTNLDASPDTCGDITGPFNSEFNPQLVRFQVTMPCTDPDGNGQLDLPWCTTWRQPGANDVCQTSNDAYPGSPSKCNCGLLKVPIFFETVQIKTTKSVLGTGQVPETGGSATYTVAIQNPATVASITLDSLTDDKYGDITTVHAASGGFQAVTATTCTLATIAAGTTYNCQFTGTVPPGDYLGTYKDIVTACGTDSFGHPNLCSSDDATVTYSDVPEEPSVSKTVTGKACQIDATYAVVVTNNSAQDVLTLNTLTDNKFGSLVAAHAATATVEQVVSTTCAVPQTIQPNGSQAGNQYSCSFVGRINSCSLTHQNTVTATSTDDDGANYSDTASATVTIDVH